MFSLSIFALSLFSISNAWPLSKISDFDTGPPPLPVTPALDSDSGPPAPYTITSESAIGPVSQLFIGNEFTAPDGFTRLAVLANGVFPAPLIQAVKNDEFNVQIINGLEDDTMPLETSVHWHGIFQRKTNWADGVAWVTQCPLRPDEMFTAKFRAVGQTGTYWYHSHYLNQYCDGLRGALVIYDPQDPLGYMYDVDDNNTVITLAEWYHTPSIQLSQIFGHVLSNSTLINGRGRYAGGPPVPLSVINVQPGLRYRFRVVSLACDPAFNFTIDGHRMTIIEVDGNEVLPVEVDSFPILAGQRYSVVVTADQPVGNYWIRSSSDDFPTFEDGQNLAILRYEGAPDSDPTSEPGPYELDFDEGSLHPLINPRAPGKPEIGKADVNIQLVPGYNFNTGYFEFNNVSWSNPPMPVLLQILSGARHPSQLLPNGSVYELEPHKVVEISFPHPGGAPGGPHPIHLHGHSFSVVRVSGSNETNFVNPVRRDVVSIGREATDNVVIRFVTDNPGPWFLHCHIDWHLNHGFAVVMAEAPTQTAQQEHPPPDWEEMCYPGMSWGQTTLGLLEH